MAKKRTIQITLLLAFVLMVLFVVIDLLLASVFIRQSGRTYRTQHAYYHHGLLPNQAVMAKWYNISYPLYTNSLGFRDTGRNKISLEPSKKRILLMGDSHTEGVGLRYSETFAGQLSGMIDTSAIEILNAAAVSYSPRIYYLKTKYLLEEVGLKFDEMFVFIDISDLQNEIVYEHFDPKIPLPLSRVATNLKNSLINRSFTLNTFTRFKENRQVRQFLKKAELFDEYRKEEAHVDALNLYASFFSGFDDKTLLSNPQFHGVSGWIYDDNFITLAQCGLEIGAGNLRQLSELCRNHGIKLTISVHPWPEQIARMDTTDIYNEFWRNFAEEYNVGFINLYPSFIYPPFSAAMGAELFIPGDNHWNRNGHWLVANTISKHIVPD